MSEATGQTAMTDRCPVLCDVGRRLAVRFPSEHPVLVHASVQVAKARLRDRPIRDFMPILVERAAASRLRELAG